MDTATSDCMTAAFIVAWRCSSTVVRRSVLEIGQRQTTAPLAAWRCNRRFALRATSAWRCNSFFGTNQQTLNKESRKKSFDATDLFTTYLLKKKTTQEFQYVDVDLATNCLTPHGQSWNTKNIQFDKTVVSIQRGSVTPHRPRENLIKKTWNVTSLPLILENKIAHKSFLFGKKNKGSLPILNFCSTTICLSPGNVLQ